MQYEVSTPYEYLETIEKDWKYEKIQELRSIIKETYPELKEEINYKMLGYKDEKGHIFHLNAQKTFVGFYVGDIEKIDPDGTLLHGLNCGKGCIRISKSKNIDDTGIRQFIKRAVELWKEGKDIGC